MHSATATARRTEDILTCLDENAPFVVVLSDPDTPEGLAVTRLVEVGGETDVVGVEVGDKVGVDVALAVGAGVEEGVLSEALLKTGVDETDCVDSTVGLERGSPEIGGDGVATSFPVIWNSGLILPDEPSTGDANLSGVH